MNKQDYHKYQQEIYSEKYKWETPLGVEADKYISKGNLVPDDITVPMVEDRLTWDDAKMV